jgi:UrcA family protein
MFRTILTGALALSAALVMGAATSAADLAVNGQSEGAIKLHYAQADLHSVQGAKAMARRIREAADEACGSVALFAANPGVEHECREAAIDRAVKDLNAPLVADALGRTSSALASAGH